jgi:hypothetical protein
MPSNICQSSELYVSLDAFEVAMISCSGGVKGQEDDRIQNSYPLKVKSMVLNSTKLLFRDN